MNRALTGFPLESVIEKVQFSRLPGSNLSLKEEVLMSSFFIGSGRAYGRLGGRHFPFFDREQTNRRQSAERIVEFEIDCFAAIVELYHFGFDQAVGCINGIEDIGVF